MKSKTLPKVVGVIIIIIAALLVIFGIFLYTGHMEHNHEQGHIDIEQVVSDEEHEYVLDLGFSFELEHEGDHSFPVWLHADSSVVVKELESTMPCTLTLYDKEDKELWSDQIKAGMEITPGVEEGEYRFLLIMCGNGKGKIVVDDGCEEEEEHDNH